MSVKAGSCEHYIVHYGQIIAPTVTLHELQCATCPVCARIVEPKEQVGPYEE